MNTPNPTPDPDVYADNQRLRRQIEDLAAERNQLAMAVFRSGAIVGDAVMPADPADWTRLLTALTDVLCDCYPGGFTPETYEGPQRHCPVHGDGSGNPAESAVGPSVVSTEGSGHPHPSAGPWTGPRPTLTPPDTDAPDLDSPDLPSQGRPVRQVRINLRHEGDTNANH